MAQKVIYRIGTKETYLGLEPKNPYNMYYCYDTRELYRGYDLVSDGVRVVDSKSLLPDYSVAADGILYFCKDNGTGFVLNNSRDGWIQVVKGIDNETIGLNEYGLMYVKSVPLDIAADIVASAKTIATKESLGMVMASDEILVGETGAMSIGKIAMSKVDGLEEKFKNIEDAGSALYVPNSAQFEIDQSNNLNIKSVSSGIVYVGDKSLTDVVLEMNDTHSWGSFDP